MAAWGGVLWAQPGLELTRRTSDDTDTDSLTGEAAERAALVSLDEAKYVRAREQAEAILDDDPKSFVGTWVLANALYHGEANFPRALFTLRKARDLLFEAHGDPPQGAWATRWHRRLLETETWILGDMERFEEELEVIEVYDSLYKPSIELERAWPLIKLRRFDEARELVEGYLDSDDDWDRARAFNLMINLAWELRDRDMLVEWTERAIERTHGSSCVILANAAEAALATMQLDKVEDLVNRAHKARDQDCPIDPRSHLVKLYLTRGEYQKAISTAETVRDSQESAIEAASSAMEELSLVANVLYLLGRSDDAVERGGRIVEAPDRLGFDSTQREQRDFSDAVFYQAALSLQRTAAAERAAVRDMWGALEVRYEVSVDSGLAHWAQRRRALRLATHEDLVVRAVRPNFVLRPWLAGTLVQVLGAGVVIKAVAEGRELDGQFQGDYSGYYDALEGEARWRRGDEAQARELGARALDKLPEDERLLRWRTHAWVADIAWSTGRRDEAADHYAEVLEHFPTAIRLLDLTVPVRLQDDGSGDAGELADRLSSSPRLDDVGDDALFVVDVTAGGDGKLSVCLLGAARGERLGCAHEAELDDEALDAEDADRYALVADRFHLDVLAPRVDLTQKDINSLEGSPNRVNAERALEGLLGTGGTSK